jgi:hypothetical protein
MIPDHPRILVCGGRAFWNADAVDTVLEALAPDAIIQGGAQGADALAAAWGDRRGIEVVTYEAKWRLFGAKAGPIRNAEMLESSRPDCVVAFPGGAGTADMVSKARAAGVVVGMAARMKGRWSVVWDSVQGELL